MSQPVPSETRVALMQCAESLLRSRGYCAFSYADLAETVGIRKASVHYHFRTKEELGLAVAQAYVRRSAQACADIRREQPSVRARVQAFVELFMDGVGADQLPLCGALAAEMAALPSSLQELTRDYFRTRLDWLQAVLAEGAATGELPAGMDAQGCAHQILSLLEGAAFINWALGEHRHVEMDAIFGLLGLGAAASP